MFLPIPSLLSVINANESKTCDGRLLISSFAASAPNSACLPQNKTHADGSKTLKDLHTSAGDVFLHLILASKQFDLSFDLAANIKYESVFKKKKKKSITCE